MTHSTATTATCLVQSLAPSWNRSWSSLCGLRRALGVSSSLSCQIRHSPGLDQVSDVPWPHLRERQLVKLASFLQKMYEGNVNGQPHHNSDVIADMDRIHQCYAFNKIHCRNPINRITRLAPLVWHERSDVLVRLLIVRLPRPLLLIQPDNLLEQPSNRFLLLRCKVGCFLCVGVTALHHLCELLVPSSVVLLLPRKVQCSLEVQSQVGEAHRNGRVGQGLACWDGVNLRHVRPGRILQGAGKSDGFVRVGQNVGSGVKIFAGLRVGGGNGVVNGQPDNRSPVFSGWLHLHLALVNAEGGRKLRTYFDKLDDGSQFDILALQSRLRSFCCLNLCIPHPSQKL